MDTSNFKLLHKLGFTKAYIVYGVDGTKERFMVDPSASFIVNSEELPE